MAGNQQPNGANAQGGQYQDTLTNFCRNNGMRPPSWQAISDRRGGRTAWSCIVQVSGLQPVQARFWYDGQYVNSAREDAAQVALQRLGQLPPTGVVAGAQQQQQQPQQQNQPQQLPQQQQQGQQHPQQQQPPYQQGQNQQGQPQSGQSSQQGRYYGVIGS